MERFRDATARKPSGSVGRWLYRGKHVHERSFKVLMEKLQPTKDDVYLDVACGAGILLRLALTRVGRAAAIDHSHDMVALAAKINQAQVDNGVLEIVQGRAESLPWPDESFSCVSCANAFFFMENPQEVIVEMYRVLKPAGRMALVTMGREFSLAKLAFGRVYGLKTYTHEEMRSMLCQAGFGFVEVGEVKGMQVCFARKAAAETA